MVASPDCIYDTASECLVVANLESELAAAEERVKALRAELEGAKRSTLHESWEAASREKLLDALRFQGAVTRETLTSLDAAHAELEELRERDRERKGVIDDALAAAPHDGSTESERALAAQVKLQADFTATVWRLLCEATRRIALCDTKVVEGKGVHADDCFMCRIARLMPEGEKRYGRMESERALDAPEEEA